MRIVIFLFTSFLINAENFKSFEAEFTFNHFEFGKFKMNRKFEVTDEYIYSSFKLRPLLIFEYSQKSSLKLNSYQVLSNRTEVKNNVPGVDPSFFAVDFSENAAYSKELNFNISGSQPILDQLGSDLQMRVNAKNKIQNFTLEVIDNDKGNVVSRNYVNEGFEEVETSFGVFNCIKISATAVDAGKIIYYLAPELDYLIIKSLVELKNGKINTLTINKRPKFSAK